ncbi:uncharacterized protein LOC129747802 [Uranotaenia lowii]|uniref:uncharacterized protein LOC129747802 n=1 Tax=Uranotaenia lowii TaxID=190385 RepID=UPI002479A506|nr:uncharacterized protein LOC129747802 [Uranotaenia lowii]
MDAVMEGYTDATGVSSTTVYRAKKRAGLSTNTKIVTPNRDYKQNTTAKARSRRLYTTMLTKFECVVVDDETYVKADYEQLPGQKFYTAKGRGKVADIFKHMKLSKFAKKSLVFQAICTCGLKSSIFIASVTVNQEIYVKECLNKRLLPFLKKHGCSVLFWHLAITVKRPWSGTPPTTCRWFPRTRTLPIRQSSAQ